MMSNGTSNIFDANTDDAPFNQGGPIGFDPNNQYIGLKTPIDLIGFQGDKSPSAMDETWGGIQYTKSQIGSNLNRDSQNGFSISRDSNQVSNLDSNQASESDSNQASESDNNV